MKSPDSINLIPKAVIFDMDGLMLDNVGTYSGCWRKVLAKDGLLFDRSFLLGLVSLGSKHCREKLSGVRSNLEIDGFFLEVDALYNAEILAGLRLKPGLVKFLDWLQKIQKPLAVATTTARSTTDRILEHTGLRKYFSVIVTEDDIARTKPAPDIYLKAAALLSVSPNQCVVLEDSPYGVESALAAGMTPIQVPDLAIPTSEVEALGHLILPSLTDAHAILERIWNSQ